MSIRRDVYNLCKTIWSSPIRNLVQTTIHDLNTATDEQIHTGCDRSSFGYVSRQLGAQLLGYLVVDREKEKYPLLDGVQGLSSEEEQILIKAHKQLEAMDKRCIGNLVELIPECSSAVDPYFKFRYVIPDNVEEVQLYDEVLAQQLVESFQFHPAILTAIESSDKFKAVIPETEWPPTTDIVKAVFNMEQVLLKAGPLHPPRKLWEFSIMQRRDSPNQVLLDYICALMCIKASLDNLNELLFQALLTKKLPILDEDNIIEVGNIVRNISGTGFTVKYQPDEQSGFGDIGLILIKAKIFDNEFDLYKVEEIQVQVSREFGDTVNAVVRKIDENLNPYGPLLQNISRITKAG